MIISVVNLKGGSGKTTLALVLASILSKMGKSVMVVDTDKPQYTASLWDDVREGEKLFHVERMSRNIASQLSQYSNGFDFVILDAPPRLEQATKEIIDVSDLVVVPVNPSGFDYWAANDLIDKYSGIIKKAVFVLNRVTPNSRVARSIREGLENDGQTVLTASLGNRVAFSESMGEGKAIYEADPRGSATREAKALVKEILKYVNS